MIAPYLPPPLFGLAARTAEGRQQLATEQLHDWVKAWSAEADTDNWWIDAEAGLALFRPQRILQSHNGNKVHVAALCIRGSVTTIGRMESPDGWNLSTAKGALDTLLYDFLERDTAALRDLQGAFALACWDGRRHRLLLTRDPIGQRPLFIATTEHLYLFCSELSALLRLLREHASYALDKKSVFWYLAFGLPAPGRTLHHRIRRVSAAHVVIWEPGQPVFEQRYWTPLCPEAPTKATPNVVQALRDRLDQVIVTACGDAAAPPPALLLSGGVDSTYIAATCSMAGKSPTAFTVRFEDKITANEHAYASAVAKWFELPHHVVPVYAAEAAEAWTQAVQHSAEPCSAWATLSHFHLLAACRLAGHEHLLSGLGADEIFGGYDHYRMYYARMLRYLNRNPPPEGMGSLEALLLSEKQSVRRNLYPGVARFFSDKSLREHLGSPYNSWNYTTELRAFYEESLRIKPEITPVEAMIAHECQYRIPDLLMTDFEYLGRRMGITTQYPFLDPELIRMTIGLEIESRYQTPKGHFSLRLSELDGRYKWVMMQIAAGRVPQPIIDRPRKSYTAPFAIWMHNPVFATPLISNIQKSGFWDLGIVDRGYLEYLTKHIEPGPGPHAFEMWILLTLTSWFDRFMVRPMD
jgi:asparagine synthase (glutamine-hydrolysing)